MNKLDFLTSRRFWAIVGIGLVSAFEAGEVLDTVIANSLKTILGGFVVIGTIDKFRKK